MLSTQEVREHVIELLKSYPSMIQKIALLRHEWKNPAQITDSEMLSAMTFSKGEPGSRPVPGHISDKTYHIAVNYHSQAVYQNKHQIEEIESELERIEKKMYRLEYCVSQLPKEQQAVIQGLYFESIDHKTLSEREHHPPVSRQRAGCADRNVFDSHKRRGGHRMVMTLS